MEIEFYTVEEFSQIMKVCNRTILNDIRRGRIIGIRAAGGKRSPFRIPITEVERLLNMRNEEKNKRHA